MRYAADGGGVGGRQKTRSAGGDWTRREGEDTAEDEGTRARRQEVGAGRHTHTREGLDVPGVACPHVANPPSRRAAGASSAAERPCAAARPPGPPWPSGGRWRRRRPHWPLRTRRDRRTRRRRRRRRRRWTQGHPCRRHPRPVRPGWRAGLNGAVGLTQRRLLMLLDGHRRHEGRREAAAGLRLARTRRRRRSTGRGRRLGRRRHGPGRQPGRRRRLGRLRRLGRQRQRRGYAARPWPPAAAACGRHRHRRVAYVGARAVHGRRPGLAWA